MIKKTICLLFLCLTTVVLSAQTKSKAPEIKQDDVCEALAYKHIKQGHVIMLTYGIPPMPETTACIDSVAKKYGFAYRWIAGCIVSEDLAKRTNAYNLVMENHLQTKHGKNWHTKFDKEYSTCYKELKKKNTKK